MKKITTIESLDATVEVPGSKSITQRALIAAALAEGDSVLIGPLASEDTSYTMGALRAMHIEIDDRDPGRWLVRGTGGVIGTPNQDIFLGNNGTATRFLTSVAALGHGRFRITGDRRMAERPIAPLMEALRGWQVEVRSEADNGCPPLKLDAKGLAGGRTVLPEGKSSQYLSSLLLVAPYAAQPAELEVRGEVLSRPYVEMTLAVMADFGIRVEALPSLHFFRIPQGRYTGREYRIEGDASGASYFWAAAAVTGGRVTVANVPVPSLQGDANLVPLLARMGCTVHQTGQGITVQGPDRLEPIEADMGDMPDVAPTLAIVAAFAEGTTIINNVAHLRIKECDRVSAMVNELRRMGAEVEEEPDRMLIHGRAGGANLHGATIETYHDHRIAMCFAVAGLRVPGVEISGEECVAKSFPDFWERFSLLWQGATVSKS
jgi:3-phosphoshikimate 1-carboxyvinyltransferase